MYFETRTIVGFLITKCVFLILLIVTNIEYVKFKPFFQSIGTKPLPSIPKDVVDDDLLFDDEIDYINKQKLPEVSPFCMPKYIQYTNIYDYYTPLLGKP